MMDRDNMEKLIKKILVGTDFSSCSDRAVDYAAHIAEQFRAEILLVHAIESFTYSVTDSLTVMDHEKALSLTASALLENLLKSLNNRDLSVKSYLTHGTPYREIVKKAEEDAIDLIVLGTHGRSGVEHFLLGSVAEKVVRTAPCPVLTIPSNTQS